MKLIHGDCLEVMKSIPDGSIDLILTDPPYGTTACRWDTVISMSDMWLQIKRVLKKNGIAAIFGSQPFTSALVMSNTDMFRYEWIWEKESPTGFLNSRYKPLKKTEDILIFSDADVGSLAKNKVIYYPQGVVEVNREKKNNPKSKWRKNKGYSESGNVLNSEKSYIQRYTNYPTNILKFSRDKKALHPTQKPVALMEYMINTYTKPGEMVLDFTMGSGTTGVACKNLGREFIGIEKDETYFKIAESRINSA